MSIFYREFIASMQRFQAQKGLIKGYAFDSRKIGHGELFFALKGAKCDGHAFLEEVAKRGAMAAVVSRGYKGPTQGLPLFFVDNVTDALQALARESMKGFCGTVIGITGSFGKTTTKEFLAQLLNPKDLIAKTIGNANSQVGLPLFLLNAKAKEGILIVEMGMSSPGQIKTLVSIIPPKIALVTGIALAHVDGFTNGLEGIAEAKAEIFSHPETKKGFISSSIACYPPLLNAGTMAKTTFGVFPEKADTVLHKWNNQWNNQWIIEERGKKTAPFSLPFTETHLCENFLAAAVLARSVGMEWEEIFSRAHLLAPFPLRYEKVEREGILFINDCYNANPTSMRAALANLPKPKPGRKTIAVLGEMPGLAQFSEREHREVGIFAKERVDYLFCYRTNTTPLLEAYQKSGSPAEYFEDFAALKKRVFEIAKEGDCVLIKGANDNQLWRILDSDL